MGVLVDTGEHREVDTRRPFVPLLDPYKGFALGELPGEHGDISTAPLYDAANPANNLFLYGKPVEAWEVYLPQLGPEAGRMSSRQLAAYLRATEYYVPYDTALTVAEKLMDVAESPIEDRITIFEDEYRQWAKRGSSLPLFAEEIHRLLGAHHPQNLIRGGEQTEYPSSNRAHRTEMRFGFSGAIVILLVSYSRIDEGGVLRRGIDAIKTFDPEYALSVANEPSLEELLRVQGQLEKLNATDEESAYVLQNLDRRRIHRDRHVPSVIEELYADPEVPRWTIRAAGYMIKLWDKAADSRAVGKIHNVLFGRKA